ncbi:hypothetical protein ACE38W_00935 [Chitinophaga sp. Hz27]|uniref:hypothetical protein n=1 Tax=Chitinophaga sp. Hz27 TaxID=3347169 RepID=UPI0035DD397E
MKTQEFLIRYIIVHVKPINEWAEFNYHSKKNFHFIITVSGKKIPMKKLIGNDGCIDVVFVGSDRYAMNSMALFSLLLDLWIDHPDAKITYAADFYNISCRPILMANHWLLQHMPHWIGRRLPSYRNLFLLKSLLPELFTKY